MIFQRLEHFIQRQLEAMFKIPASGDLNRNDERDICLLILLVYLLINETCSTMDDELTDKQTDTHH